MRQDLFLKGNQTGKLVRISHPFRDVAFVPDFLPPTWEFDASLWPLLADARAVLGKLDGIGRSLPNPYLLLKPLRTREALRSSSLEGTWADPADLLLYQRHPRDPMSARDPANALLEVSNYEQSLIVGGEGLRQQNRFSLGVIRQMHHALLFGVRGRDKSPGAFRPNQVHIGSDRRFIPPPAEFLNELLENLVNYINEPGDELERLARCFVVHYQFEAVHPFIDGNGRVGRVLLSLMIYHLHEHHSPWLYLSPYFERYKDEYFGKLFGVSTTGAWTEWIEFCLRGVLEQSRDAIARSDRLIKLMQFYHSLPICKRARLPVIVDSLFEFPLLHISDVMERTGVTFPTARSDVEHLVESGVLRLSEGSKPMLFIAQDIYDTVFEDEIPTSPVGEQADDDPIA